MSDGIYAALSGAVAQERALDVVANNVANVGTTGFRGDRLAFRQALAQTSAGPAPTSLRFVEVDRSEIDMREGPIRQTGNPLDLALSGSGFFVVRTEAGERLTRDGSFVVGSDGVLRTQRGAAVMGEGDTGAPSEIVVPPGTTSLSVGADGTLSAGDTIVGRVRVVDAAPGALRHEGHSLFVVAPGARTEAAEGAVVLSGCLEGANVGAVEGMNELITANRAFDAFQRVIAAFRDIDNRTARDLGGGG